MRWCGAGGQAPTTGSMQSTAAGLQVFKTELTALLGGAKFFEATYRLFKVPGRIETLCEDYGQAARYKARRGIRGHPYVGRRSGCVSPAAGSKINTLHATPAGRSSEPHGPLVSRERCPRAPTPTSWTLSTTSRPASGTRCAATRRPWWGSPGWRRTLRWPETAACTTGSSPAGRRPRCRRVRGQRAAAAAEQGALRLALIGLHPVNLLPGPLLGPQWLEREHLLARQVHCVAHVAQTFIAAFVCLDPIALFISVYVQDPTVFCAMPW